MEVVTQIGKRFKVEPVEIKKVSFPFSLLLPTYLSRRKADPRLASQQSISSLIDREYLRRKDGELNVFEYLA